MQTTRESPRLVPPLSKSSLLKIKMLTWERHIAH